MPEFKLRIWAEQTLTDHLDYVVTADTLEAAVERLDTLTENVMFDERVLFPDIQPDIRVLDPTDIVADCRGVALIDDKGERVRDLIGVPTECDRLGDPLHAVEPVETMSMLLFTLHISHKTGDSMWVFDDEDKAHACLANWARQWWDKDGPRDPLTNLTLDMPEQDADVVEEYFGRPGHEEYWHIGEDHLNAF